MPADDRPDTYRTRDYRIKDRVEAFINSYISDDCEELEAIYDKALRDKVPVMRKSSKEFIKTLIKIKQPDSILEIGTAVGYSALFMSKIAGDKAKVTTVELDEARATEARENITRLGRDAYINVINADASMYLKELSDTSHDFIFVDAAKGQYINYYEDVLRVAKPGAVIISDNILQEGEILESHYTVEKRNRTIHDRIRDYLYLITHDERVDTSILSIGDGMALTVKR